MHPETAPEPRERRAVRRSAELLQARLRWLGEHLRLSVRGLVALAAALASMGVAAVVLAAVSEDVVTTDGIERRDPRYLQAIVDHRSPLVVGVSRLVTDLGGVAVLAGIALVVGVALWFRHRRVLIAGAPAVSLLVAGALAGIGKVIVARQRPPVGLHLLAESDASFPSGHSTDSAALFLSIALVVAIVVLRRPVARVVTVVVGGLLAVAVGVSRLVLGVHWPTDVLAGWALGALVAIAVTTATLLAAHLRPLDPSDGSRLALAWRSRLRLPRASGPQRAAVHGDLRAS
jgi:undecaprenyl-diphosphatase